jgi:hypothetical protein
MLEIGKTYLVNSSRKGTFLATIKSFDETWATVEIVAGKAKAMLHYNERDKGEEVTVRRSFCTFAAQPDNAI